MIWIAGAFVLGEVAAYLADGATAEGTGMPFFLTALFFIAGAALPAAAYLRPAERISKKAAGRILILFLLFLSGAFRMHGAMAKEPAEQLLEENGSRRGVRLLGLTDRVEEKNGKLTLLLSEVLIDGEQTASKVRLSVKEEDCSEIPAPGDRVLAIGMLSLFEEATNPGQFDFRMHYRGQGVRYRLLADRLSVSQRASPKSPAVQMAHPARAFLSRGFGEICTEEDAAICRALLLGDRSGLEDDLQKLFRDNGISHILAVSGLHVSLIGLTVYELFRQAGAGYAGAGFVTGLLLLLYGTITGFGASVFRAVFMVGCRIAAAIPGRGYDMLSAWGLALLLLAVHSPWLLFSSGLQLSFGAVLAIGILGDLEKEEHRARLFTGEEEKRQIPAPLRVSLFLQLFVMPITLWHYFRLPVLAFLLNLAVIPLLAYAAGSAICAVGLWSLSRAAMLWGCSGASAGVFRLARMAMGPCHYIFLLYRRLCEWTGRIPFAQLVPGRPSLWRIVLFYLLLWMAFGIGSRTGVPDEGLWGRIRGPVSSRSGKCLCIIAALLILLWHPARGLDLWFLDVGQGDGLLVRTADHAILSDCGSSDVKNLGEMRLLPALQCLGTSHLDYILVSHADEDHVSGIRFLLEECRDVEADTLVMPAAGKGDEAYGMLENAAAERGMEVVWMKEGDKLRCGDLTLLCMNPGKASGFTSETGSPDRNAHSLVFLAEYGRFRMMLTGDIGAAEEERILRDEAEQRGMLSVLKTAHHGSGTSTSEAFLRTYRPGLAVISCGKENPYGHPAEETINRLRDAGTTILCTAWGGAVHIWTNGRKIRYTQYSRGRQNTR